MKPKVLVVDDDPVIRKLVRAGLAADFEVSEASSCDEASAVFRKENPTLVLLDIGLPDGEGTALIEPFVNSEQKAVVIMLTSDEDMDTARQSLGMGASEYLTKPFQLGDLRIAAKRWLGLGGPVNPYPWRRKG